MSYCRVEAETNAYYTRIDRLERMFGKFRLDNLGEVVDEYMTKPKMDDVHNELLGRLYDVTLKTPTAETPYNSDYSFLGAAVSLACYVYYGEDEQVVIDALEDFGDAVQHSVPFRKLVRAELERRFDLELPYLDD